jgi:hypothetical protein
VSGFGKNDTYHVLHKNASGAYSETWW